MDIKPNVLPPASVNDEKSSLPSLCIKKEPDEDGDIQSTIKQESNQGGDNNTSNLNENVGPLITQAPLKCEPTETNTVASTVNAKLILLPNGVNIYDFDNGNTLKIKFSNVVNRQEKKNLFGIEISERGDRRKKKFRSKSDDISPKKNKHSHSKRNSNLKEMDQSTCEQIKSEPKCETHNFYKNENNHALKNSSILNNDRVIENIPVLIHPRKSKKLKITQAHPYENLDSNEMFQTNTCKKLKIDPIDEPTEDKDTTKKNISDIMRSSESKKLKTSYAYPNENSDGNKMFQTTYKRLKIEPVGEPTEDKGNISDLICPCKSKRLKIAHDHPHENSDGDEMFQTTCKKLKIDPVDESTEGKDTGKENISDLIRLCESNKFKHSANDMKLFHIKNTYIPSKHISNNKEKKRLKTKTNDEQQNFSVHENDFLQIKNCTSKVSLSNDIPAQNISKTNEEEDEEDGILVLPIIKAKKNVEVITISDDEEDGTKVLQDASSEVFQVADSSNKIFCGIEDSPVKNFNRPPKISSALSYDTMGECTSISTALVTSKIPEHDLSEVNTTIFDDGNSKYVHEDKNRENAASVLPVLNEKSTGDSTDVKDKNCNSENHSMFSNTIIDKISFISACFSSSTSEIKEKKNFSTDILRYFNVVHKLNRFDCQMALNNLLKYETKDTVKKYFPRARKTPKEIKSGDILFEEGDLNIRKKSFDFHN